MVYQENSLFPWMNVIDNACFGLRAEGVSRVESERRASPLLQRFNLAGWESAWEHQLSAGMKQRVAVIRSFLGSQDLLLMDEPFAALDEQTRLLLGDKVLQIQQELKQTTLLITHNITEAVQLSDRIMVMTYRPGKIKRVVDIDLPRPRTSEVVGSDAFGHYVAQIWADLREEASRGMSDDESRARATGTRRK